MYEITFRHASFRDRHLMKEEIKTVVINTNCPKKAIAEVMNNYSLPFSASVHIISMIYRDVEVLDIDG